MLPLTVCCLPVQHIRNAIFAYRSNSQTHRLNAEARAVLDAVRGLPDADPRVIAAKEKAVDLAEDSYVMISGGRWYREKYIISYSLIGAGTTSLVCFLASLYAEMEPPGPLATLLLPRS